MSHEWLSFVWCSNSMSRNWCAWCKHCAFLASSLAILTSSPISQMNPLSFQSVSWLSALVSRSVQPIVSLQYGILLLHKNTTLFWLNDLLLTNVECLLLATKCCWLRPSSYVSHTSAVPWRATLKQLKSSKHDLCWQVSPSVDVASYVRSSMQQGCLVLCLSWVVDYLSMVDIHTLQVAYYQHCVQMLNSVY